MTGLYWRVGGADSRNASLPTAITHVVRPQLGVQGRGRGAVSELQLPGEGEGHGTVTGIARARETPLLCRSGNRATGLQLVLGCGVSPGPRVPAAGSPKHGCLFRC